MRDRWLRAAGIFFHRPCPERVAGRTADAWIRRLPQPFPCHMVRSARPMMHPAAKISLSVAVIILTGAILAPAMFFLGKGYAAWGAGNWVGSVPPLEFIRDAAERSGFNRYFNRAILLAAIIWLVPLWKWLARDRRDGACEVAMIGFLPLDRRAAGHGLLGFALAAGLLAVLGWFLVNGGLFRPADPPKWSAWSGALLAGVSVALLEEWFFRGLLFAILRRAWSTSKALIFLTLFFALVHFLKPPEGSEPDVVTWWSGFGLLGAVFGGFGNVDFLLAEFAMLTAVGLVLGLAALRTGSLWLPVGLHAGWVFGLKWFGSVTATTKDLRAGEWLPWMGTNLKIGLFPLITVLVTGALALWITRARRPVAAEREMS